MDYTAHKARREYWREIIRACNNRDPKLSKAEWLKQNGIRSKSYYYWQKQFRNELLVEMQGADPVSTECKPVFFEVAPTVREAVETNKSYLPTENPSIYPELMIRANGCEIYISSAVQSRTLETVMKVIAGRA